MRSWANLIFLVLAVSGVSAYSAKCPADEVISPCGCDDSDEEFSLILSCDRDISYSHLRNVLDTVKGIDNIAVQLDEINLGVLASDFFEGLRIKKLDISHCNLISLTDVTGPALRGLEDTLEELEIMASFKEDYSATKLDLSHMRRLKKLDMSHNDINELGNDWFAYGPVSLHTLILSNNGIRKLGDRAFASLYNLKVLHLDGNRFGSVKRSMLPYPAHYLSDVKLDDNDLLSIPEDFFIYMPALRTLSLRKNMITQLPRKTWEPIWQSLEDIHLDDNPLVCDSHIEWMFYTRTYANIYGKCQSPPEKDGFALRDVIEGRH
ncbi:protein artichoke-like [Stegodyphus dumicola]|uniref:protein artichoke-like n=1 Tax=Stegodyphus dumicola TaxID=202533 RepID=UPI0015B332D6|nr:protein artichoke-like [Stegodyphus dumicola]